MSSDLSYSVKWHLSSSCRSPSCKFCVNSLVFCVFFQFYECFLILFHCSHWSADNGNTSMPSKTTVIQLNRRVFNNTAACADHLSASALKQCCSANTIPTKNTPTIEVKLSWSGRIAPGKPLSILCMCLMCDVVPVKVGIFRLPVSFFLCACTRLSFHTTGPAQAKCQ